MKDFQEWPLTGLPEMQQGSDFDVAVIGAGPAGLCAVLRLLDLGYKVVLIEQENFPRNQIGESLSAGIQNIFSYLGVEHLLENPSCLKDLPARIIWEDNNASYISGGEKGGVVVNRGILDKELLAVAVERGAFVLQPAKLESSKNVGGIWNLKVRHNEKDVKLTADIVMDARGRKGVPVHQRIHTAAPMVAIWTHLPYHLMPVETQIEAVKDGWFWGSVIPCHAYRIMAFADPETLKNSTVLDVFKKMLSGSKLFAGVLPHLDPKKLETCSVLSYCHTKPWDNNYIRIGEAAFALDPLSSTGVEKAMRFSLQAVIAVNTLCKTGNSLVAQSFYEEKLLESVLMHTRWTREFYQTSWAANESSFWKKRSDEVIDMPNNGSAFAERLKQKLMAEPMEHPQRQSANLNVNIVLNHIAHQRVKVCSTLAYKDSYCIADNLVEIKEAVHHPNLQREVVYLDQIELKPLLDLIQPGITFNDLLLKWYTRMPVPKAKKMTVFLWDLNILQVD